MRAGRVVLKDDYGHKLFRSLQMFYQYEKEVLIDGVRIIKQEIDDPKEFLKKLK